MDQPQEQEIEDIDQLLDEEDPGFRQELSEVAEIKPEVELDEEGALEDFSESDFEEGAEEEKSRVKRLLFRTRTNLSYRLNRAKIFLTSLIFNSFIFLKTKPKELVGFLLGQLKIVAGAVKGLFSRFAALPRKQKGLIFVIFGLSGVVALLTIKNLKGVWLPNLNPPIVYSMSQVAEKEFLISGSESLMFYKAFPRDPDLFLFEKFKVNLKPSSNHPNPMGAFEVVLELDSKAAAIEVQSRQIEFHDLIQRNFETQTYPSMLTDLGKMQLKNLIKKDLDERLSQGWVEDVHFQTFILKP